MIERAYQQILGETGSPVSTKEGRARPVGVLLYIFAILFSTTTLPIIYAIVAAGQNFAVALTDPRGPHIVMNALVTGLVMLGSIRLKGRLDRKLGSVLVRVLIVHGGFAFFILISRQFHSNTVMLTAMGVSILLGTLVMLAYHVVDRPRIALLGPWHSLLADGRGRVDWIERPSPELARYDVLLTSDVVDLSAEWSGPLSRAMLMGRQVRHVAEFVEESQGIVSIDHFNLEDLPAGGLTSYRTRKRMIDIALTLLALPLAVPLFLLGAALVFVSMGRPVLFKQSRIGLGGRSFCMYKLRTMRNTLPGAVIMATAKGDPRITGAGRFLRRFRIDELPQLWNVLIGDMSVIGPRPEERFLNDSYVEQMPAYVYRSLVRPGITGWAQVRSGYAANLEETRTKLTFDLFYIKNFSFALDVQILVRTIWTLLLGGGAR